MSCIIYINIWSHFEFWWWMNHVPASVGDRPTSRRYCPPSCGLKLHYRSWLRGDRQRQGERCFGSTSDPVNWSAACFLPHVKIHKYPRECLFVYFPPIDVTIPGLSQFDGYTFSVHLNSCVTMAPTGHQLTWSLVKPKHLFTVTYGDLSGTVCGNIRFKRWLHPLANIILKEDTKYECLEVKHVVKQRYK